MLKWLIFMAAALSAAQTQTTVYEEDVDIEEENEGPQVGIWYGPGWYNGIWFDNEDEYNHWQHNNPHDYNHQHFNGGQPHQDMDRDMDRGGRMGGGGGRR